MSELAYLSQIPKIDVVKWMFLIALLPFVAGADTYSTQVLADKPVAYWRFDEAQSRLVNSAVGALKGQLNVQRPPGPRPLFYPDFDKDNHSLRLTADDSFVGVTDPGKKSRKNASP